MSAVVERERLTLREAVESAVSAPTLLPAVERYLMEASPGTAASVRADGLVPLVVIRPGVGRGKGNHLYQPEMLNEAVRQGRFKGWKMYVDHQSPEAKKKAGGLPRSMRELGGVVKEAWWDNDFTTPLDAQTGHGRGAVLGLAKPTRFMRSLIEDIPEAVGASISAAATGVRPMTVGGKQVWLVEGIQPRGSVDWVTEAGAGGKVISMMEALEESWSDDLEEAELMGLMTDDELRGWLARERPELLESLSVDDDFEAAVRSNLPRTGGNRAAAEAAARNAIGMQEASLYEGGDDDMTPEAIAEALSTDEGRAAVAPIVEDLFVRMVAPRLGELIEAALEDERELMQAEADASATRKLQLRDLRDLAHTMIRESRLPEAFQAPVIRKYEIGDGGRPTAALDVLDVRENGSVVMTAEDVLREAVESDIEEQRTLLASARPTRVRGQGAVKPAAGEGGEKPQVEEAEKTSGSAATDMLLQESGFGKDDLNGMWDD